VARCLIVLADGLRPDAITRRLAPRLSQLRDANVSAVHATTIRPSVTVAALTSLATGVAPATHGLTQPGLGFLLRLGSLRPLGRELARAGVRTTVVAGPVAPAARPVAWALASSAGVARLECGPSGAPRIADAALAVLGDMANGLLFVYLPDADQAGHASGWMSPAYLGAVAAVDDAAGRLATAAGDALTIVLADHGGGGVHPTDHDLPHPVNDHIPLILSGPAVARGTRLAGPVSLLDVPATVLHWFGRPIPECYEGRPLLEAFAAPREAVA